MFFLSLEHQPLVFFKAKLTSGKSFGIDIFNTNDLSNNSLGQTKANVHLEDVSQKVEILKENILKTTFQVNYFDVVVSNLCLHNLYKKEDRRIACSEIHRITKPEGQIIISDYKKHQRIQTNIYPSWDGGPKRKHLFFRHLSTVNNYKSYKKIKT